MKKTLLLAFIINVSCKNALPSARQMRTTEQDTLNSNLFDEGQDAFSNHCISCHHIDKKEGFLSPSVMQLIKLDSIKRTKMLRDIVSDTTHQNIISHINKIDFEKIKYFINSKASISH